MIPNKDKRSNGMNMSIGLVCALSSIFIAFEWQQSEYVPNEVYRQVSMDNYVAEMIPISYRDKKKVDIPIPKHSAIYDQINIVDDLPDLLDDELDIIDENEPSDQQVPTAVADLFEDVGEEGEETPLVIVEVMPRFPGGKEALFRFLGEHVNYPYEAQNADIQGTVYVQFVVTKSGEIKNVRVAKSVHPSLDMEALRVVKMMPKWIPGSQQGRKVSVYFSIPIKFILN